MDLSDGNFMLAATDFDIAGVGDRLQLTHTHSSFADPYGDVSATWFLNYERWLQFNGDTVDFYDSTGATVEFTKNTDGTYATPKGYSLDLVKNSDGTYSITNRKNGSKDTYTVGTYGADLTKVTDPNGDSITVTQHTGGGYKLTEARSGRWIDLTKVSATQWQAADNTGRTAVFGLNAGGDLTSVTDTAGKTTAFAYDSTPRITRVTSPDGDITNLTYDSERRITSLQRVTSGTTTGPTWTYAYSAPSWDDAGTTTVTTPDLHATDYTHDADGQVTKVTDPLGHSRSKTYDGNHNTQTAVDAMGTGGSGGNTTTYGWDSRNNPTAAKLPTGATAAFGAYATISGRDLPPDFTDANGNKTSYTYDTAGNTKTVATTGTGAATLNYTYNPATPTCGGFQGQRCTAVDANGKTTTFHYDTHGNLDKVTPPTPLGVTTYTYDALGRPATAKDGRNVTTTYTYDDRDRTTNAATSGGASVTYTYDGDGNQRTRADPTGTTTYAVDKLNRETVRTLIDSSHTVLAYSPDGNVDTYTDPTGPVDYGYDAAGRLTTLKDPSGATTTYGYDNNDARTRSSYPGGTVQTLTLDNSGRPTKVKTVNGTTTMVDLDYTYAYTSGSTTKDGSVIRTRTDNQAAKTMTYTYDTQGRLTYAKETGAASWLFCYDPAGNLLSQSGSAATCPGATTYTYNNASQVTSKNGSTTGWAYNAAGDETAGASTTARTNEGWSDFNQLTSLTTGGTNYTAAYSGTDNAERTTLGTTTFHNGPEGLVLQG